MSNNRKPIPQRIYNASKDHPYVAGAVDIIDDRLNKDQQAVNQDTYRKSETYSKEEVNHLVTTPDVEYVTLQAHEGDTLADIFSGVTGADDTIYRVASWNGEEYDDSVYSEYAWDGTDFVFLDKKEENFATADDFIEPDEEKRAKVVNVGAASDVYGSYQESPEWIEVKTDSEDKVLEGIREDGTKVIGGDLQVLGRAIISEVEYTVISNPEYVYAIIDSQKKIVLGINTDGKLYADIAVDSSPELSILRRQIEDADDRIKFFETIFHIEENPEWIQVTVDKEHKVLEGITTNGTKVVNMPIENPAAIIDSPEDPEWLNVITDRDGKILEGITKDGKKVVMVDTKYPNGIPSDIKEYVDASAGGKETITPFYDSCKVYTVCNDIKSSEGTSLNSRNYSARVYIDHLYSGRNSMPKMHIESKSNFLPLYSKYEIGYDTKYINSNTNGQTNDVDIYTNNIRIVGDRVETEAVSVEHVSTRNLATKDRAVRLLCIGDSVTFGSNAQANAPYQNSPKTYWEWVKALFEMDRIENGGEGFFCETLGNYLNGPQDVYGGEWITEEHRTFDINFNGITESNVMACAAAKAGAKAQWFLESQNGNNPFWDSVNNKFSLSAWISNYRTLVVNQDGTTTRCDNANKGTLVTDVNAYNVCEPTHVLLAFGYNQAYSTNNARRTQYLNALNSIITSIKEEYPNIIIMLHLPDTAGTYFPDLYPNYIQENNDIYSLDYTKGVAKEYHDDFCFMNKDLIDMEDVENGIYYVPSYFVSPLCLGVGARHVDDAAYMSSQEESMRLFVEGGTNGPHLHPNNTAHATWAYQIYSLIKYTLI